jgi:hypothetical protein
MISPPRHGALLPEPRAFGLSRPAPVVHGAGGSVEYVRRLERDLRARGVAIRRARRSPACAGARWGSRCACAAANGSGSTRWSSPPIPTSACACWPMPRPSERRTWARSAIRTTTPCCMPTPRSCPPAQGLGELDLYRAFARRPRADRALLLDELAAADPAGRSDDRHAQRHPPDPRGADLRHPHLPPPGLRPGRAAAQEEIRATNGTANTWFCGAWMRNGFHEDGFASAVDVVEAMGTRVTEGGRMSTAPTYPGRTFHGRRGAQANRFTYGVDYLLIDPEARAGLPWLFSRNRAQPGSLHDADHGGAPGAGEGVAWVRGCWPRRGWSARRRAGAAARAAAHPGPCLQPGQLLALPRARRHACAASSPR